MSVCNREALLTLTGLLIFVHKELRKSSKSSPKFSVLAKASIVPGCLEASSDRSQALGSTEIREI